MQTYRNTALAATATLVNAEPAGVSHIDVCNLDTADRWLQIYDAAAAGDVTVGTTTPKYSVNVPLGDGTDYGRYVVAFPSPIKCTSGVVVAATTTPGGNTAPTNSLVVHLGYD